MDLLEILPWGREEAEMEKAFLSEAWLSAPMLEEEYNDRKTETRTDSTTTEATTSPKNKDEMDADQIGTDGSFTKWMEMNDMELALYQQNFYQQSLSKGYIPSNDWDGSDSDIPDNTQSLLLEFETICDGYNGALTPPSSRTPSPQPAQSNPEVVQPPLPSYVPPTPLTIDIAKELAMLDELVRDRAEALENASPKNILIIPEQTSPPEIPEPAHLIMPVPTESVAAPIDVNPVVELIVPDIVPKIKVELVSPSMSPGSLQEVPVSSAASPSSTYYLSPNSVASSMPESPRPNSPNSSSNEEASDPEWMPARVTPKRQRAKPYSRSSRVMSSGYSSSERSEFSPAPSTSRGRRAPRGKVGTGDRKERKKEQNKNAATRYRQKKKAEAEVVASEERQLEMKNDTLRSKAADLAREVSYLKKLMKDLFKARGML